MTDIKLKPIKSEVEYDILLNWIDTQFNNKVEADSETGKQVKIALEFIRKYEDEFHPIPFPQK